MRSVEKPAASVSASRSRSVSNACAVPVELPAVELHDQALGGEQRVDLVAGDPDVDQGPGEFVALAELQEVVLERRAGGVAFEELIAIGWRRGA